MLRFSSLIILIITVHLSYGQTEPGAQPTDLNFSGIKPYRTSVSFTSAWADGHLVVISQSPITFNPADNTTYIKGQRIGDVKVGSAGGGTFTFFKNLRINTTYHVAVYAYNEQGGNVNYKSDSPLSGTITTPGVNYGTYYNNIDFSATNVVNQLTNLIQTHTQIPYSQFDETIVADFFETDTVVSGSSQKYVTCQYSNEDRLYTGTFAFVNPPPGYSREHRMAFSWINFQNISRAEFEATDEGCDVHALDLVQNDVNSARSNEPFGKVENIWANSYLDFKIGTDITGLLVAEPKEDIKGDVARALFYMMLCYNGKYGQNWGLDNLLSAAQDQDIQTLLDWHYNDLPDDFEKTRHEYVWEKQGNRNPFIDFPQLVDCIDFSDMTKRANCDVNVGTTIRDENEFGTLVYPNPSNGMLFLTGIENKDIEQIRIFNLLGAEQTKYTLEGDSILVDKLAKGTYIVSIKTKNKNYMSKFQLK